MKEILKFRHDLLEGEDIHIRKKQGDTSYKNHWHSYYEIILYLNCEGKCILNGEEQKIEGNCLYLLTPRDFHKIETAYRPDSGSYIISFSEKFLYGDPIRRALKRARVIKNVPQKLSEKIEEMHIKFQKKEPNFKVYLKHLLSLIVLDIAAAAEDATKESEHISPAVLRAIELLQQAPESAPPLIRMAKDLGLSPSYFSDAFHSQVGVRYSHYCNSLKVAYAKRLLEETELSVMEVGLESGFGSTSQFHRVFKALAGVTPYKYRVDFL